MKKIKSIINKIKYLLNPNIKIKLRTILDSKTFFEGGNVISKYVDVSSSSVGYGTYIGKESYLVHSKIGKFCSIAPNVKVCIGSHPTKDFVSIHPSFYSTRKQSGFTFVNKDKFKEFKKADDSNIVVIGNDVWIGSNVLILEGVRIGDGAIIGAGSVISKDIEPYSINVGNPIKILRYRFTPEQIDFLLKFKWWDRDIKWLKENAGNFENIDNFIKQLNK